MTDPSAAAKPTDEPILRIKPILPSVRGLTPLARRAAIRVLVSDVLDRRRNGTCLR